jgi:hypothetical protein
MVAQLAIVPGTVPSVPIEGVAAIAMRLVGSGSLAQFNDKELGPTLGLPVSTIVACSTMDELKRLAGRQALVSSGSAEPLRPFR